MATNNAINGPRFYKGSGNPYGTLGGLLGDIYFDIVSTQYYVCTLAGTPTTVTWRTLMQTPVYIQQSTSVTMVPNTVYVNFTSGLTYTLPPTIAVGTTVEIDGYLYGFNVAQASGQSIIIGNNQTMTGTGGSLSIGNKGGTLVLRCIVANTTFQVISSMSNFTVV